MNDSIEQEMSEIATSARGTRDLWSTAYLPPDGLLPPPIPWPWTFVSIMQPDIIALGYDTKLKRLKHWTSLVCNNDMLLLSFYRKAPPYERYWFIEYDVRYSGNWGLFLDELDTSSADLLCTNIERREEGDKPWMHWDDFVTPVPEREHIKGFLPVCRVSRRLLSAVDQAYQAGWSGHPEAVWPTVAVSRGMLVEDIGGTGAFVPETRRKRFYYRTETSKGLEFSTFGNWPHYSRQMDYHKRKLEREQNVLWHPVK